MALPLPCVICDFWEHKIKTEQTQTKKEQEGVRIIYLKLTQKWLTEVKGDKLVTEGFFYASGLSTVLCVLMLALETYLLCRGV